MAVEVQVPVGGEGAEEYVLVRWLAATGDRVTEGEALFEIETAKATYDVPAPASGLLSIDVAEGTEVSAHQVVGTIGDGAPVAAEQPPRDELPESAPVAEPVPEPVAEPTPGPATEPASVTQRAGSEPGPQPADSGRVAASPRARSAAAATGADLSEVQGTGPGGRVLARDVPAAIAPPAAPRQDRTVIARRMSEAAAIPTVTLHRWCDGTVLRAVVDRLRAQAELWDLPRVSVGDVLAAVVARVLPRHPALNAHWVDGVRMHESVHLGFAVDAPWGLVVPVVRDAQRLSLGELSRTMTDLAAGARARTVGREEITGSTFTITNLGATGVEHFTPLLNPPEVAILGVGALVSHGPDGANVPGLRLPLSLTFDHRAVDGAPAGRFLAEVADGIEAADALLMLGEGRPQARLDSEGGSWQ